MTEKLHIQQDFACKILDTSEIAGFEKEKKNIYKRHRGKRGRNSGYQTLFLFLSFPQSFEKLPFSGSLTLFGE